MKKEPYDYDSIWKVNIEYAKNQPIRKNKKEKEEFIMQEIKSIKENGPISYIDKIRYDILISKIY